MPPQAANPIAISAPGSQLQMYASSGLTFPWADYNPDPVAGSLSLTFGPDGVTAAGKMLIYWSDLADALQQLLGYSWRDATSSTPRGNPFLRRKLPWQHPLFNQLWVKRIAEVRGLRQQGRILTVAWTSGNIGGGVGTGFQQNLGPRGDFYLAELTIQFWRPPYYVRTDTDILDANGNPQEWLRYTDKHWEQSLNMLSRENSTFQWMPALGPYQPSSQPFTGSVGQTVTHMKVSRTWYQIPEQALFATLVDATPNGLPTNTVYTQTACENPLSKFDKACGATVTTTTIQTNSTVTVSNATTTAPVAASLLAVNGYTYPAGSPMGGCVNAPVGGGAAVDGAGNWVDATVASRFFGCYSGTLRFDGVTFEPQPLQLPPVLMQIPFFPSGNSYEAISQVQYNVTFHFDLFDPPGGVPLGILQPAGNAPIRGHNMFPWAGNGLWYPLMSYRDSAGGSTVGNVKLTPFHYCDFSDLFRIL